MAPMESDVRPFDYWFLSFSTDTPFRFKLLLLRVMRIYVILFKHLAFGRLEDPILFGSFFFLSFLQVTLTHKRLASRDL